MFGIIDTGKRIYSLKFLINFCEIKRAFQIVRYHFSLFVLSCILSFLFSNYHVNGEYSFSSFLQPVIDIGQTLRLRRHVWCIVPTTKQTQDNPHRYVFFLSATNVDYFYDPSTVCVKMCGLHWNNFIICTNYCCWQAVLSSLCNIRKVMSLGTIIFFS